MMGVPVYTPISSEQGFYFLLSFPTFIVFLLKTFIYCMRVCVCVPA